jgi:response regulator RpfG family c-di-GMP phosphodiesterase
MNELDRAALTPAPTAARPLLGLTVLVVEDSRFACEAMRLLCLRSGARIRRADCLKSARRHLQVYRPAVVIVDMGLPDGSGAELIEELATAQPRVDVILGTSGEDANEELALTAGADGFLAKPLNSLASFQSKVLAMMPPEMHPPGLRQVVDDEITPDMMAFHDDIAHVADLLSVNTDDQTLDYVAQCLKGVAMSVSDAPLSNAVDELAKARASGEILTLHTAKLTDIVQERLAERVAI